LRLDQDLQAAMENPRLIALTSCMLIRGYTTALPNRFVELSGAKSAGPFFGACRKLRLYGSESKW
jgi:hypothetical protein